MNMVYSAALRKTGNAHAAEEITQAVFIILANKAGRLSQRTILSGWLYQATRLTAANFLRTEVRRVRREQEAYMQSLANATEPELWPQMAPLLEDAMGQLGEKDRNAIALRFFRREKFSGNRRRIWRQRKRGEETGCPRAGKTAPVFFQTRRFLDHGHHRRGDFRQFRPRRTRWAGNDHYCNRHQGAGGCSFNPGPGERNT